MTILSILIAILLLGILIAVHEFGHFFFSRLVGIEVREYAIGMGPLLLSHKGKNGTQYSLRLIPVGGYCSFYGEDDITGAQQEDPRAFAKQPVWKRMISVLMGPGMNFILAFVVAVVFFAAAGITVVQGYQPYVQDVAGSGPAYSAGMQAGDVILTVNGQDVMGEDLDTFTAAISAWQEGDAPLALTVQRGEEILSLELTPFWDLELGRYRVGITVSGLAVGERVRLSLGETIREAWNWCVYAGGVILNAVKNLVTTGEGLDQTSGPVGVVSLVSQEVRNYGMEAFLNWLIVISINLGIMNLLPIPGLDGARFLFLLLEAIRRKPVPPEAEAKVHLAGYVLLFGLMILLTYRDIANLFR